MSQFEQLAASAVQRPATPPNGESACSLRVSCAHMTDYSLLTPAGTPDQRTIKPEPTNRRFLDTYDTSMEETIKPRGNQRSRGVFEEMRRQAEQATSNLVINDPSVQTQFHDAPLSAASFTTNIHTLDANLLKPENQNDGLMYGNISHEISPAVSYLSTPDMPDLAMFENNFVNDSYDSRPVYSQSMQQASISPAHATHSRSQSVSSAVALDEPTLDTGITMEDIAAFISGPDATDGKWLCLYPECNKRFGRKENIKSHVQTHLGDRQYQCPHCNNRFVRQHDLKRHAKIHSGVKPYPCRCGNSFARHDALTRHRQRGMCIGAFEGVVKKTAKRGRPRKNRPEDEKRIEKSSRTRAKNKEKEMSSTSSSSGCSESSDAQSPRSEADITEDVDFADFNKSLETQNTHFLKLESPAPSCISPQIIHAHSPSVFSSQTMSRTTSATGQDSMPSPQQLPALPPSPTKSIHSYHSPPGLCDSSSSPAPSQYYDLDDVHNPEENLSKLSLANISEADEIFFDAFGSGTTMSALERNPGLLLGKFDDSYNQAVDMFADPSDVFFGSP